MVNVVPQKNQSAYFIALERLYGSIEQQNPWFSFIEQLGTALANNPPAMESQILSKFLPMAKNYASEHPEWVTSDIQKILRLTERNLMLTNNKSFNSATSNKSSTPTQSMEPRLQSPPPLLVSSPKMQQQAPLPQPLVVTPTMTGRQQTMPPVLVNGQVLPPISTGDFVLPQLPGATQLMRFEDVKNDLNVLLSKAINENSKYRALLQAYTSALQNAAAESVFYARVYQLHGQLQEVLKQDGVTSVDQVSSQALQQLLRQLSVLEDVYVKEYENVECFKPIDSGKIGFHQIAGLSKVKQQMEIKYILPFAFPNLFGKTVSSLLLYGPPGTGKTMIVRAATRSIANAAFFAPSPGELRGKYEGETEKNIARLFKCANEAVLSGKYRVAIIFIDEFDSLGGDRSNGDPGMQRSVNALLQGMDGVIKNEAVSVIGATNLPWSLDSAILRRFQTKILVDLPDSDTVTYMVMDMIAAQYFIADTKQPVKNFAGEYNTLVFEGIVRYGQEAIFNDENTAKIPVMKNVGSHKFNLKMSSNLVNSIQVVKEIVTQLMNNTAANELLSQVVKNPLPADNDNDFDAARFTYSPSDIANILLSAVQLSAFRALSCPLMKQDAGFFIPVSLKTASDNSKSTVYAATNDTLLFLQSKGLSNVQLLPKDQKENVRNFTLFYNDIAFAIVNYPNTLPNKQYIRIQNYALHNSIPS